MAPNFLDTAAIGPEPTTFLNQYPKKHGSRFKVHQRSPSRSPRSLPTKKGPTQHQLSESAKRGHSVILKGTWITRQRRQKGTR